MLLNLRNNRLWVLVLGVKAYVLVVTAIGNEYKVCEEIEKAGIEGSRVEADVVYGEYDIVAVIEAADLRVLDAIVTKIRRNPNVLKTTTLISSKSR